MADLYRFLWGDGPWSPFPRPTVPAMWRRFHWPPSATLSSTPQQIWVSGSADRVRKTRWEKVTGTRTTIWMHITYFYNCMISDLYISRFLSLYLSSMYGYIHHVVLEDQMTNTHRAHALGKRLFCARAKYLEGRKKHGKTIIEMGMTPSPLNSGENSAYPLVI